MRPRLFGIGLLLCAGVAQAEDVALRARAEQMLERARAASTVRGTKAAIRTEVTFQATADDGSTQSGSYIRLRGLTEGLKQELHFGEWAASSIQIGTSRARIGPWEFPPYAARVVLTSVPFGVGRLSTQDVVREIKEVSSGGQPANCIEFDTIEGEEKTQNEICLNKADGTLLEVHDRGHVATYSRYGVVAGSVYPGHIEVAEGTKFRLSADVVMTSLDTLPEDAFKIPEGVRVGTLCKTSSSPIGRSTPQPAPKGADGSPVIDVAVRAYVTKTGSVTQAHVLRPVRPDLDAEALKLVATWQFDPSTCNGEPNTVPVDMLLHFQGW